MNSNPIILVSGLPRSGTSLMMQMLANGGLEVVTDNVRSADTDNPRGYFEFEPVKRTKDDASWVTSSRGKVVKMVSQLLYDLPASERYQVIFMERDLDETLASQEKMLSRLNKASAPRDAMKRSFEMHLAKLHQWLKTQTHFAVLNVSYNSVIADPAACAHSIAQFLGRDLDVERMAASVDPTLYRNRKAAS